MKRKFALLTILSSFISASTTLADQIDIPKPAVGYSSLSSFVTNIMTLAFGLAILIVLVMLIWGAFEWITSGGDKETVGKARGRIVNALIGLAVLAVAFALAKLAGQFLGFDITKNIPIPTPPPAVESGGGSNTGPARGLNTAF